jgi:hypothetical protein
MLTTRPDLPPPMTAAEALKRFNEIVPPRAIVVEKREEWWQIVDYVATTRVAA